MKFFLFALIVALFATVQITEAKKCAKGQFLWKAHKPIGEICIAYGGTPAHPKAPSPKQCPKDWEWCKALKVCKPYYPIHNKPKCPFGVFDWAHYTCYKKPTPPKTTYRSLAKRLEGGELEAALEERAMVGHRQYRPRRDAPAPMAS